MVGALNWGLVGLFDYNLVHVLLGGVGLEKIVYILVGVSAVFELATHAKNCRTCTDKK